MRNTVAGCLLAAALISPRPAEAQCVTDQHSYTTHAEKISINTDSSLHGAASDAAAMWNQCSGLPVMHANDNLDALPINVVFHWGASPRADGACAQAGLTTSWNTVVGGTITIWEQWGQGASAHLRGQLCTYNWGGLIAHEIGHILGLANTGCADHIMGPDWSRLSGPASGECANVNVKWTTPEAQKEMCDLSCSAGECIAGPAARAAMGLPSDVR